jgi:hypothetical protein
MALQSPRIPVVLFTHIVVARECVAPMVAAGAATRARAARAWACNPQVVSCCGAGQLQCTPAFHHTCLQPLKQIAWFHCTLTHSRPKECPASWLRGVVGQARRLRQGFQAFTCMEMPIMRGCTSHCPVALLPNTLSRRAHDQRTLLQALRLPDSFPNGLEVE